MYVSNRGNDHVIVFGRNGRRVGMLGAATLLGLLGALLLMPSVAPAQSICEQYPNLPVCVEPDDGGGDRDGDDDGDEDVAGAGAGASAGGDGDGELPFTGYPLTPLLLLLLALLLAGLTIRAYLAARERRAGRGSPTPLQ